jgi:DNA-binding winged helix-turn-helix (wHTH) protein
MDPASETLASVAFGRFRVLPHRRELLADGRPIKLGGRAFDVLKALIEARGTVLGKDALMARVWPNRIVDEKNLHAQISALRAALGADRELIHTVPGRGISSRARPAFCRRAQTSAPARGWPGRSPARRCRRRTCRSRFPN